MEALIPWNDFYLKCPQITLTDSNGRYCSEPYLNVCQKCISLRNHNGVINIEHWIKKNQTFLSNAKDVITPSYSTKSHMIKTFPRINFNIKPHEVLTFSKSRRIPYNFNKIRIGIIGALSKEKGFDLLETMINYTHDNNLSYEFILFGNSYREPILKDHTIYTCTGPYSDDEVSRLFNIHKPHLFWFPACWPETYSYTFSHVISNGFPVIYPDIGAFKERANINIPNKIIPWDSSPDVIHRELDSFIAKISNNN